MRTVDAALTDALAKGHGRPILIGYIGYSNGSVKHSDQVLSYKLTGQTLEFKMPYAADFASDQTHCWLERGMTVGGVDYTITTGRFRILEQTYLEDGSQICRGALFPNQYYSAAGDDTYENVITALCTAFGKTAVFKDDTQAWLDYQFLADGQYIEVTDANKVLQMLQQKRLITLCDNGDEEVLVYCADVQGSLDATLYPTHDFKLVNTKMRARQYISIDEAGTYHQSGTASNPIHNLGYLESTDSAPSRKTWSYELDYVSLPDLRFMDGDILKFSLYGGTKLITFFAQIVEEFDPGSRGIPAWRTRIQCNPIFHETAGGDGIPAALRIGNYQPLNTSRFAGALTSNETDVQAAFDKLANGKEVLTAARHYYVDTAGDDANDGLSSGSPFATLPHACAVVATLNMNGKNVTIHLADGTYSGYLTLPDVEGQGTAALTIQGNTSTPANVVYQSGIVADGIKARWQLDGFKIDGPLYSMRAANYAVLFFKRLDFGAATNGHINANSGGLVRCNGNYTISSGAVGHFYMEQGGMVYASGYTVTLTGTPAFSGAFCYQVPGGSNVRANGNTYSGAATGKRYDIQLNAVCAVLGAGANYFPGNAAGTTATGGQYA
jgi:hypothetical protein